MLARAFQRRPRVGLAAPRRGQARAAPAVALPGRLRRHGRRRLDDAGAGARRRALAAAGRPPMRSRATLKALVATPFKLGAATAQFLAYGRAVEQMRADTVSGPHWYLAGIGVDPSAQRQGIGAALLAAGPRGRERAGVARRAADEQRGEPPLLRVARLRGRARGATRPKDGPQAWAMVKRLVSRRPPKRFPDRDEIAGRPRRGGRARERRRRAPRSAASPGACSRAATWGSSSSSTSSTAAAASSCSAREARTGEVDVHLGDIVGAIGKPTKSRRGEPSLIVDELVLLSRIRSPLPDTFHGLTDVEQRYRRRYLDLLMNEETRADFLLRAQMVTRDPARTSTTDGLRRGRDAGAAAALRRRVRPAVRHPPQRARPWTSTCASRPSSTSSA